MSKVILSYSLFDQNDKKFDRSGHDPYSKNFNRYWTNLPFIVLSNKMCFPDSETRIYVPKDLESNPMFFFLNCLNKNKYINLQVIDKPHSGTEPTIWRMDGVWSDADFCFCRDIDSVMTSSEVKSMNFFMQSNFWIHNIRSVKQHNVEGTSLMAGLSGFNIQQLKEHLPLPDSFAKYENFYKQLSKKSFFLNWRSDLKNTIDKNGHWGCDQETLLNFFIKTRSHRIISKVLDTYSQPNQKRVSRGFRGAVKPNKYYKVSSIDIAGIKEEHLANINKNVLNIMDKAIVWSGQPINANGTALKELLAIETKETRHLKKIILENDVLRKFYL